MDNIYSCVHMTVCPKTLNSIKESSSYARNHVCLYCKSLTKGRFKFLIKTNKIWPFETTVKSFITLTAELLGTENGFDSLFFLTIIIHSRLLFYFNFKEASLKSGLDSTYYDWIGMTVGFQSGNIWVCQEGGGGTLFTWLIHATCNVFFHSFLNIRLVCIPILLNSIQCNRFNLF